MSRLVLNKLLCYTVMLDVSDFRLLDACITHPGENETHQSGM
jgi:hypothetical protein